MRARRNPDMRGHGGLALAGVVGVGVVAYLLLHKGRGVTLQDASSVLVAPGGGGGSAPQPTEGSQFTQAVPQQNPFVSPVGPTVTDVPPATASATLGYGAFDPSRTVQRPRPRVYSGIGDPVPWTDISEPHPRPQPPPMFQNTSNRGIFDEPFGWANPW
jgi:hypothetical protein